jgi:hypothetical protein
MRAEVERAYQGGGLAAATAEEEEASTPPITVDQIVARTTGSGVQPSITSLIIQNKDQAMARLRSGREEISSRREEARQREAQDRWLAFGQAMLQPSRTGGLGENIGMAAGAIREERGKSAQAEAAYDEQLNDLASQEIAVEANAIDQLLTQAGHANSAKGIHGAIQVMVNPDHVGRPVAEQQLVFGAMRLDQESGEWGLEPLADKDGVLFEAADRLDPARASALITAAETAESQTGRGQAMIDEAYSFRAPIANVRRANDILEDAETIIETSGFQALKNRLANWLGIDFGDTVELTELQMIAAEDYLQKLTQLKGNTSDRDVMEMKGISVGLGQNTTANYRQLRRMEAIYSTAIRRGIREAYQSGEMDAVGDLWEAADGYEFDSSAVFIKTQKDYDNLDAGTKYYRIGHWGSPYGQKPVQEESAGEEEE